MPWPDRILFSVDGIEYAWGDVLLAGWRWGEWEVLESSLVEGLACRRRQAETGEALATPEIEGATAEFRYARNLLSATEMREWLEERGLTIGGWQEHFRRVALRRRWRDDLPATVARFPPEPTAVNEALWPEGVCSGVFERWAELLAGRAAASVAAGVRAATTVPVAVPSGQPAPPAALARLHDLDARLAHLAALDSEYARFCEDALTPEALDRRLRAHDVDWLHAEARSLDFACEDAAREALLCVRADGLELEAVAERAGISVAAERFLLADVEPAIAHAVLSASLGEVLGPVAQSDRWSVVAVDAKVAPTFADEGVRRRAEQEVIERAVAAEARDRIEWRARP